MMEGKYLKDAELAVLRAMRGDVSGMPKVADADFSVPAHQYLCRALEGLRDRGQVITRDSIMQELTAMTVETTVPGELLDSIMEDAHPFGAPASYHVVREAGQRRRGDKVRAEIVALATNRSVAVADFVARARTLMGGLREDLRSTLRILTGRELWAHAPTPMEFRIDNLLPAVGQALLVGKPGEGKSMLMRVVAGAVATGEKLFGALTAKPGKVVWVTAEETEDGFRRGLAIVVQGCGYPLDTLLDNLVLISLSHTGFHLGSEEARDALEEAIRAHDPALVVLDSLTSLPGVDTSSNHAIHPIVAWGRRLSISLQAALVWIAHTPKGSSRIDVEAVLGAQTLTGYVDCAYHLRRSRGELTVTCTKMRETTPPDPLHLSMEVETDRRYGLTLGEGSAKRAVTDAPAVSSEEDWRRRTTADIRTYLLANPGAGKGAICEAVPGRNNRVGALVDALSEQGSVENRGTPNRHALYWARKDDLADAA